MRKGQHQRPHRRRSRLGTRFKAGRGTGTRIWGGIQQQPNAYDPKVGRVFRHNPRYGLIYMENVKERSRGAGNHFFDRDAIRFFNSRIPSYGLRRDDKVWFVTSEKFDYNSPRLYTVRVMSMKSGQMLNEGSEFQEYNTKKQAERAMLKMAGD